MKARLTCRKIADDWFSLVVEVDVDETLVDFECTIAVNRADSFHPGSLNGVDTAKRISHRTGCRVAEEGKIAVFQFKYETEAGSFEIGYTCEVK